jgi:UDP-N-acetylglucosamine--N-acetylmuramyl-(pentapeptide) pyrophosphoryl-undecaprenol N-acetylglucosamine transferase
MSVAPIMIMAGGTGGHVFPGLAVAEILRDRDQEVVWLGTQRGLEARLVPARGIEIEWISISGVRGKGPLAWLAAPFRIAWSVMQALAIVIRRKPGAVLGLGGFVAGPGGIAAWLTRRPLILHEQNAVAGTTNRLLSRFATRVFEAFPGSFPAHVATETIGNPVRDEILAVGQARRYAVRPAGEPLHLLVLGGSQGSLALNRALPAALAALPEALRPVVRHQAGRTLPEAEAAYGAAGVEASCLAFIDDVAEAYAWADLVVARAGALTVSELAAAGVGAILVPYPYAIDDHQMKNAGVFSDAGACVVLAEAELEQGQLSQELERLLSDRELVAQMAQRCHQLMHKDAALQLADTCTELAGGRR